ncbi:Histidine-specific methyltransferase EgtD [Planctomycetales bacterium 10988]|nr:Histidine-specific methyltransferase EgtD [Planctomycetales bacterium 10988]
MSIHEQDPAVLAEVALTDLLAPASSANSFLMDVLTGMSQPQKQIPCKYLYDQRGSQLFDQICELDEYYLTRTEVSIMKKKAGEMATACGPGCMLVEFGSGSSVKTRYLLDELESPAAYVPIDISRDHLIDSACSIAESYPGLEVLPVCADFTQPIHLPDSMIEPQRRVAYFPGSTLGNFDPAFQKQFFQQTREMVGPSGGLLIGADLKKDRATLEAAYDDREGVTREFNYNLLRRINRELEADFDPQKFRYQATYQEEPGRVEMVLISREKQQVRIAEEFFDLEKGEAILTEHSYKFDRQSMQELGHQTGWELKAMWTDPQDLFGIYYLEAK